MSRIGKNPVEIHKGVEVKIDSQKVIRIKGPKGELTQEIFPNLELEIKDNKIYIRRASDSKKVKALHGLLRALLANMMKGVTEGFERALEVRGDGYKVQMQGKELVLQVGYSHRVTFTPPPGVEIRTPTPNQIIVSGYNKQQVGNVASQIRAIKPPEPYKGKGICYIGEQIRRKAGKSSVVKK
jgi:large subunit ribosomal protein L6